MSEEEKTEAKDSGSMIIARMESEIKIEDAAREFKKAVKVRMEIEKLLKAAVIKEQNCLCTLNSLKFHGMA